MNLPYDIKELLLRGSKFPDDTGHFFRNCKRLCEQYDIKDLSGEEEIESLDFEEVTFAMSLKAFEESEGRVANLNNDKDLLVVSAIHTGVMYALKNQK